MARPCSQHSFAQRDAVYARDAQHARHVRGDPGRELFSHERRALPQTFLRLDVAGVIAQYPFFSDVERKMVCVHIMTLSHFHKLQYRT